MDKDSSRWLWFLWGRVACYALLGGLATAVIGAFCVGITGALTGWILPSPQFDIEAFFSAIYGTILGGGGGGIVGLLAFGLIGLFSPPRRCFLPPRAVLLRVFLGQVFSTLGVYVFILALEATYSFATHFSFEQCVAQHLSFIMFGVPAVMTCGEIVGAMIAFRREKCHTG